MKRLITISFMLLSLQMTGQPGYLGKKYIIQTNFTTPVLDRGLDFQIEAAVIRNLTLSLSVNTSNNKYTQYLEDYKLRFGDYPTDLASIKDLQFGLQFNYFTSKSIPAPKGIYWYGGYRLGRSDIVWNEFFHNNLFPDEEEYVRYVQDGILTSKVDFGFGFQEIAAKVLVFDFAVGVNFGTLHLSNYKSSCGDCEFNPGEFMGKYGPNLIVLSKRASNNPGGVGINIRAGIGFLLF